MACITCQIKINREAAKITCSQCNNMFHPVCAKLTERDLEFMRVEKKQWQCQSCSSKSKVNRNNDNCPVSPAHTNKSTNAENQNITLETLFNEIKHSQQLSMINNKKIDDRITILEKALQKIDQLSSEIKYLRLELSKTQRKVVFLEQQQYSNSLDIVGVEVTDSEDLSTIVTNITNTALNLDINTSCIDYVFRKKNKDGKPSNIIQVKFCSRQVRNAILQAKKRMKVTGANCGFSSSRKIFINESMSFVVRQLYLNAKNTKIDKNYKHLWFQDGKILMRKDDGGKVWLINDVSDLDKLI